MDKIKFGKKIKELREEHGWTQEQLAEFIEVDSQHLSKLETGKCAPSLKTTIALVKILDTDLRQMVDSPCLYTEVNLDEEILKILSGATKKQKVAFYKILTALTK